MALFVGWCLPKDGQKGVFLNSLGVLLVEKLTEYVKIITDNGICSCICHLFFVILRPHFAML